MMFEIRNIDLKKVPGNDFIKFLRIEIPQRKGYGLIRFGRVRYALNGKHDEQENGLPMDLGKGIFIATLEDEELEELGEISREDLEKTLQKAAGEIIKIVRKELGQEPDTISILKSILKQDYPYLAYDEHYSKPPDVLKCYVKEPNGPQDVEDIFQIAHRLHIATGENYVVAYWGSSNPGDNLDEVWSGFSLRKFDFQAAKSK